MAGKRAGKNHVVVRSVGRILGPDGKPIVGSLKENPDAHIPLSDAQLDLVGHTMTDSITYPEMRLHVIDAVRALADPEHQRTRWGRYEEGVNYYDDLSLNIHILYDDCAVLPEPCGSVGTILLPGEVQAFVTLQSALGPMLDDLGDAADEVYMNDYRWTGVVTTAGDALAAMRRSDDRDSC